MKKLLNFKMLLLFVYLTLSTPLYADVIPSTCPGNILPNIDRTSIDTTDSYSNITVPPNTTYYYSFTAAVSGTIQTNSNTNRYYNSLYISNECGGSILWRDDNNSKNKSSPNIAVVAGQQIVIAFERRYPTDINLNIDFIFTSVNTPPIAKDINLSLLENTSITFSLLATDDDNITSFPIQSGPTHGTLSGSETNLTYTPNANFTGKDTFTYQAYDGKIHSNDATVHIEVFAPAHAVADDYNTTYLTLLTGNVIENDSGKNIRLFETNITASSGVLNISSDGTFTYSPDNRFEGNDSFIYTIIDDFNRTSKTTVNIVVYPPRNDMSIIKTAPSSVDAGSAMDYTLSISSLAGEAYLDAKNVRITDSLPPGVTFTGVDYPPGWICTFLSHTLTCDATNIAPGYEGSIVIHVFAPHTIGDTNNTVNIGSDTIDPNISNNISTTKTTVNALDVDMSITKIASITKVNTTTAYSYTINIQNLGSDAASNVQITDVLDPNLGFININAGTDWTCNQGYNIICDYTANGNIFPAGESSSIVINVRAPAQAMNIANTAKVITSTTENNTLNNTSSVAVKVVKDTNQFSSVNLTKYLQYNIHGDFNIIGNANINFPGTTDPNQAYNDSVQMTYVDTDHTNNNTFNSSSSTLHLDNNLTVKWAGLYWEGHICGDAPIFGCIWSNSPYANYAAAMIKPTSSIGSVKLKTPLNDYQVITADTLNIITPRVNELTYSAFADVTKLVQSAGKGTYSVANLVLTEGRRSGGGNYGGWLLLTIYEDPSKTLSYKNISVFNGFQYITTNNTPLDITGFLTPKSGPITASVAFFAADGDPAVGGVAKIEDKRTQDFTALSNAANPANNLFNSTMTEFGKQINTDITRTYGVDGDRINISNFMSNNQTDTSFRFDVTNGFALDHYTLSMFTFATDLSTPIIDEFEKKGTIIRRNGYKTPAEPNALIYPGDQLEYSLIFTNKGDEEAIAVEIFDDFDYDGLSDVLDVDYFDATKLKLYKGSGTNNPVHNPNCGYNLAQRRVFCKIASVGINETYRMEFTLTVQDVIAQENIGKSANNTAYVKYKNPNGNSYVERYTTPEVVGGKSNTLNGGTFQPGNNPVTSNISVEAINEHFTYANNKHITTKLVNSPFNIKLVLINQVSRENIPYQAWLDNTSKYRPMPVIVTLQENNNSTTPNKPLNDPSTNLFRQGNPDITIQGIRLDKAYRDEKLKMAYLDWNNLLRSVSASSSCLTNVNDSVSLNSMPACLNNSNKVQDIFPKSKFPRVNALCFESRTDGLAPCDPLAYHSSGNPKSKNIIFPNAYNHSYGCYQCVAQGSPNFRNDSFDNFAVRPNYFTLSSSDSSFPDLLRSGQKYYLSLVANNVQDNPTKDYNITNSDYILDSNVSHYFNDGSSATSSQIHGDFNLSTADYNISNGISHKPDFISTIPEDILEITFNDVGRINMQIIDPYWARVDTHDSDDTPKDCNSTKINGITIEASAYICGDINATFIPHHFEVTNVRLHNHRDGNFTYLSDDLNMSAKVSVTIAAANEKNETVQNFRSGSQYYENDVSVTMSIGNWLNPPNNAHPTNNALDIRDIKIAKALGFSTRTDENDTLLDKNGTHTIPWNAQDTSQRLYFNYKRDNNAPVTPFDLNGSDINITVTSNYSNTTGTVDINGFGVGGAEQASFFYARVRPSKSFYPNVTANSKQTPILIDVYCDLGYTACNDLDIGRINEHNWWLSLPHNQANGDGNVTLSISNPTTLSSTSVNIISNAEESNIVVGSTADVVVDIDLDTTPTTDTNSWLIYNPDDDTTPSPFYQVEFIGTSDWTGHGKTGHVVDSNASKKRNNRLGW